MWTDKICKGFLTWGNALSKIMPLCCYSGGFWVTTFSVHLKGKNELQTGVSILMAGFWMPSHNSRGKPSFRDSVASLTLVNDADNFLPRSSMCQIAQPIALNFTCKEAITTAMCVPPHSHQLTTLNTLNMPFFFDHMECFYLAGVLHGIFKSMLVS